MATESGDSRHGGYGHECWDGCEMMATEPCPECGYESGHRESCPGYYNDSPTDDTPAGLKFVDPVRMRPHEEPLDLPTVGLTDERIDIEINAMWARAHQMSMIEREEYRGLARRIEAIVREDCEKQADNRVALQRYGGMTKVCRNHNAADFNFDDVEKCVLCREEKARKDERERAAKIVNDLIMGADSVADAILRDEDEAPRTYKSDYKGDLGN